MAEIDPPQGDDGQLLDELLGIDPRAFEEDERTQVFRSDPPPPDPAAVKTDAKAAPRKVVSRPKAVPQPEEEDAPTGIPAPVAPRPLPPRPARRSPAAATEVPSAAESLAALPLPPPLPSAFPSRPFTPPPSIREPVGHDAVLPEERITAAAVPPPALSDVTASAEQLPDESAHAQLVPPVAEIVSPSPPSSASASALGRDANDSLIGELIDGRYRVLRVLGVGGIGLVYLCQHEVLEKPVAIKVLRREYVAHDDLNERFLNEARASSAIKSPRIVDTLDVGTLPDGAPYFVMEYVEGETLAALLDREGAIDLTRAVEIAKQMAEGLDAAHAAGVIHRDLKPENVFLAPQPEGAMFVKIFDFGIAKVARARKRLTYAGAVFGTPHYMSPEQARGDEVDQRSDLYALGVMLFEMITGSVPFDGEDPLAVMSQHVDRVPPLMSSMRGVSVPPVLEAIVSRCLAKDARDRYPSANDLLTDLQCIPPGELARAAPAAPLSRVAPAPASAPARLPSLQPRAETLHAHVVSNAEPASNRNRLLWGGLIAAGLIAASVVLWAARRDTGPSASSAGSPERHAAAGSSSNPPLSGVARSATVAAQKREVHIVLSPIDSHVFRGEDDLGPMPVSVEVEDGKPVTLTVRRKGYSTRKIVLDGSETRVVVGLLRADPPPSTASKLQSLFKKKSK